MSWSVKKISHYNRANLTVRAALFGSIKELRRTAWLVRKWEVALAEKCLEDEVEMATG